MSVMILNARAIGQLVAWAEKEMVHAGSCRATAYGVMACQIVETNYAAYAGRYELALNDEPMIEARRAYEQYKKGIACIDAAVIYQFAKSIEYQCCEAPDWDSAANKVREFLRRIKARAADKMMYEILGDAAQDAWAPEELRVVGKKAEAA